MWSLGNTITALRRFRTLIRNPILKRVSGVLLTDERVVNFLFTHLTFLSETTRVELVNTLNTLAREQGSSIIDLIDGTDSSLLEALESFLSSINTGVINEKVGKTK